MNSLRDDIITILKACLHKDYVFDVVNDVDDVLRFANNYAITPIIEYTLRKANKYSSDNSSVFYNVVRVEKQIELRNMVIEAFDKNNIGYIFIKGLTLAKYYDEEFLRFSSDVDVVVEKHNYLRARDILVNDYGFIQNGFSENEMPLSFKNGAHLDLHCMFGRADNPIEYLYSDVDYYGDHELDNEFKLFHICNHGAKHLGNGFISLQYLIDLYYVNNLDIDFVKLNRLLSSANLSSFYENTVKLLNVLFENGDKDDLSDLYIDFLFNGKQTKGRENLVRVNRAKNNRGKLSYMLSRVFPKYKTMCSIYPELIDKKFLLPVCYLRRAVDILNKKDRLSNAKAEFKYCVNDNDVNIDKTKRLFEELGI